MTGKQFGIHKILRRVKLKRESGCISSDEMKGVFNREFNLFDIFRNREGFTSLTVLLAMLLSLVLIFSAANMTWSKGFSADIQALADASAQSGSNVVAKYLNCASVLDASVLTMGLIGVTTLATGMVVAAIPPVSKFSPPILKVGKQTLESRSKFAKAAYEGLEKMEKGLPYLVAANSMAVVEANSRGGELAYSGLAVPFPYDGSDGSFSSYDELLNEASEMQNASEKVKELSDEAEEERKKADEALQRGWEADCGSSTYSMYERASRLSSIPSGLNPYYPSYKLWNFGVPINRARAYYQQRLNQEQPLGSSVDAKVSSVSRKLFYEIALEKLSLAYYATDADGLVDLNLPDLPRNTSDMRDTHVYTDKRWPLTREGKDGKDLVLHFGLDCPGAHGDLVAYGSFADLELGSCKMCPVCRFTINDVGRAPLASSSIANGFEYHWRQLVLAAKDYVEHKNKQVELEKQAKKASEKGVGAFEQALSKLAAPRPKLRPPERHGVVAVLGDTKSYSSPGALSSAFVPGSVVPARAAVSASCLVVDDEYPEENVLSQFFENLKSSGAGSASQNVAASFTGGILDGLFDAWGKLLQAYGSMTDSLTSELKDLSGKAESAGMSKLSSWIKNKLYTVLDIAGFRPADLRQRKPVLVNSVDVFNKAGVDGAVKLRSFLNAVPSREAMKDPEQFSKVLGQFSQDVFGTDEFEICRIPIPGTDLDIPISVKLSEL